MPSVPVNAVAYNSPVSFFIGQSPPDGLPPETEGAFSEVYNAIQQLIQALINNCGIGPQPFPQWSQLAGNPGTILSGNLHRFYVIALVTIPFGALVTLVESGGIIGVALANATNNTKPCDGYCTTPGGIAIGTVGEVQLIEGIAIIAGLVQGTRYYLSTVDGLPTAVKPVAAGNIEQYLGVALSTTQLLVNAHYWIQH